MTDNFDSGPISRMERGRTGWTGWVGMVCRVAWWVSGRVGGGVSAVAGVGVVGGANVLFIYFY